MSSSKKSSNSSIKNDDNSELASLREQMALVIQKMDILQKKMTSKNQTESTNIPANSENVCMECKDADKPIHVNQLCKQCYTRIMREKSVKTAGRKCRTVKRPLPNHVEPDINNNESEDAKNAKLSKLNKTRDTNSGMSNENAARKREAIKSYSRYMNRRGFEDPKYYRKCGECNEVRYHRGRAANKCYSCYLYDKNNKTDHAQFSQCKPLSRNEFKKKFAEHTVSPHVLANGKKVCGNCKKLPIESANRCKTCYHRYSELRTRQNPINYRKCTVCKRISFHRGTTSQKCFDCYRIEYDRSRNKNGKRPKNIKHGKQSSNKDSRIVDRVERNQTLYAKIKPMSMEEFTKTFENAPSEPLSNGKKVCLECKSSRLDCLGRCSSCYHKFAENKRRANPDNYRTCSLCQQYAYHRSAANDKCFGCYTITKSGSVNKEDISRVLKLKNVSAPKITSKLRSAGITPKLETVVSEKESASSNKLPSLCRKCHSEIPSDKLCHLDLTVCRVCYIKRKREFSRIICLTCKELKSHYRGGKCFECNDTEIFCEQVFGEKLALNL